MPPVASDADRHGQEAIKAARLQPSSSCARDPRQARKKPQHRNQPVAIARRRSDHDLPLRSRETAKREHQRPTSHRRKPDEKLQPDRPFQQEYAIAAAPRTRQPTRRSRRSARRRAALPAFPTGAPGTSGGKGFREKPRRRAQRGRDARPHVLERKQNDQNLCDGAGQQGQTVIDSHRCRRNHHVTPTGRYGRMTVAPANEKSTRTATSNTFHPGRSAGLAQMTMRPGGVDMDAGRGEVDEDFDAARQCQISKGDQDAQRQRSDEIEP